jgi:hypothetical protein
VLISFDVFQCKTCEVYDPKFMAAEKDNLTDSGFTVLHHNEVHVQFGFRFNCE